MLPEIIHYYHWTGFEDKRYPGVAREFIDNGCRRFTFTDGLLNEILLKRPEKKEFLRDLCRDLKIEFVSAHGLCGLYYDLDIPDPEERKTMIRDHIRAMELAKEFGSQTYTVHVGAYYYCHKRMPVEVLRQNALDALKQLVPEAERIGIIVAVENSFEKPNSAKEVLSLVTPFDGNPAIGVCYDAGHANCMCSAPGKKHEDYPEYFRNSWWDKGVEFEDGALDLLKPHVVTCHLHDNNGLSDLHALPGDGTVDWKDLIAKLQECPRMLDYQSEVNCVGGTNWAGLSPAPAGGYSVRRLTETFRKLGFQDSVK